MRLRRTGFCGVTRQVLKSVEIVRNRFLFRILAAIKNSWGAKLNSHVKVSREAFELTRECAVQQLRSHRRLQARTARVARPAAPFFWLPSCFVNVANSVLSLGKFLVQAPLPLRKFRCSWPRELPGNNPVKGDKSMSSCLLQKAQKPRQHTFALYQGRYDARNRQELRSRP